MKLTEDTPILEVQGRTIKLGDLKQSKELLENQRLRELVEEESRNPRLVNTAFVLQSLLDKAKGDKE